MMTSMPFLKQQNKTLSVICLFIFDCITLHHALFKLSLHVSPLPLPPLFFFGNISLVEFFYFCCAF